MIQTDREREPIDLLAEEFADRCRKDEQPTVSEYEARHPELAEQIRALLPAVAAMEQLKRRRHTPTGEAPAGPVLDRLGDFRLIREIGRGGMGIVYEAVQESLGRVVALKVLPKHALLHEKRRERFQREAQAAARLHHTNIVPIFGVGEEGGLPYYVMQLISGKGLNEVVAEWKSSTILPKDRPPTLNEGPPQTPADTVNQNTELLSRKQLPDHWRSAARMGIQAAAALDYAHKQGTLHRDIKPANLLLDAQGTVWITDFGLAKVTCAPGDLAEGKEAITNTGDVIGTLNYMAPESFQGEADARSDVYSLGLTLYELVTLRPAFNEPDRAKLIKLVSEHEPVSPGRIAAGLPRDLETIVLKAIARAPKHRYQTAGELAEDLQRFLDDQPIKARRLKPWERLGRWCRRNRAASVAIAACFLTAIVALVAYLKTSDALEEARFQKKEAITAREKEKIKTAEAAAAFQVATGKAAEAKTARDQAEANVRFFWKCFEELFDSLAAADQRRIPVKVKTPFGYMTKGIVLPTAQDAAHMRLILEFYDRIAEHNATQPRLRQEAAKAWRRVGDIHRRLDQPEGAQLAFRRAIAIFEKLLGEYPDGAEYAVGLARARANLGAVLDGHGNTAEAKTLLLLATALPSSLIERAPEIPLSLAELCLARFRLADLLQRQGQEAEALAFRNQALTIAKDARLASALNNGEAMQQTNAIAELAQKLNRIKAEESKNR